MLEDFRLKVFEAVVSTGSFTKAAQLLDISQPAVSQNIAELEKIAGYSLFERSYGKVALTAEGMTFKSYADKILMWYRAAGETFRKDISLPVTLKIGAEDDITSYVASHLVRSLSGLHKELVFEVGVLSEDNDLNLVSATETDFSADSPSSVIFRSVLVCQAAAIGDLGGINDAAGLFASGIRLAVWDAYAATLPLELHPCVRLKTSSVLMLEDFVSSGVDSVALLPFPAAAPALAERKWVELSSGYLPVVTRVHLEPSEAFSASPLYSIVTSTINF